MCFLGIRSYHHVMGRFVRSEPNRNGIYPTYCHAVLPCSLLTIQSFSPRPNSCVSLVVEHCAGDHLFFLFPPVVPGAGAPNEKRFRADYLWHPARRRATALPRDNPLSVVTRFSVCTRRNASQPGATCDNSPCAVHVDC